MLETNEKTKSQQSPGKKHLEDIKKKMKSTEKYDNWNKLLMC